MTVAAEIDRSVMNAWSGLLRPLPIHTRVYAGENLASWAFRHAGRNHTTVRIVDSYLRRIGAVTGRGLRSPDRLQAWRRLGDLHPHSFTLPDHLDGNWITDRPLCRHCTQGWSATGKAPGVGMVCLRHRRWLGPSQFSVADHPDCLAAEQQFRDQLAQRSVFYDSYGMQAGLQYAILTVRTEPVHPDADPHVLVDPHLLYHHQMLFAELLADPAFLRRIASPRVIPTNKAAAIRTAVASLSRPHKPSWRVTNRLWELSVHLTRTVTQACPSRSQPEDRHNLLRLAQL